MRLEEIQQPYDYVISLGAACMPAFQLKMNNLRSFSGPFDWMGSPDAKDVARLLRNRFDKFMLKENMTIVETAFHNTIDDNDNFVISHTYMLKDELNNIVSGHDFPVIPGKDWTDGYPEFRVKIDRRINRFYDRLQNSRSCLFVRMSASYEDAVELRSALASVTGGQFNLLVINTMPNLSEMIISPAGWELDNVCCVIIPETPGNWRGDYNVWRQLLGGITLLKP
ncbi:DUF1796 family putative cysteine peptidase [Paenibacillus thailandensis]|uniref:DUF1796 family putative cysteine peptidase n=1 Tax=Paenibacillus thailandensis TaxID=393250 RepID=A0ABW5QRK4_9BACL